VEIQPPRSNRPVRARLGTAPALRSRQIAAQRGARWPIRSGGHPIMRAEDIAEATVEDRASNQPNPRPRASVGLRTRTGLRAGEAKKEAYLIVKMETILISG
jgi:hypothetical protein